LARFTRAKGHFILRWLRFFIPEPVFTVSETLGIIITNHGFFMSRDCRLLFNSFNLKPACLSYRKHFKSIPSFSFVKKTRNLSSRGGIRTPDLLVMSQASYHCSTLVSILVIYAARFFFSREKFYFSQNFLAAINFTLLLYHVFRTCQILFFDFYQGKRASRKLCKVWRAVPYHTTRSWLSFHDNCPGTAFIHYGAIS
jgi:hypothetical protein